MEGLKYWYKSNIGLIYEIGNYISKSLAVASTWIALDKKNATVPGSALQYYFFLR